jgi:hypothetical protein
MRREFEAVQRDLRGLGHGWSGEVHEGDSLGVSREAVQFQVHVFQPRELRETSGELGLGHALVANNEETLLAQSLGGRGVGLPGRRSVRSGVGGSASTTCST